MTLIQGMMLGIAFAVPYSVLAGAMHLPAFVATGLGLFGVIHAFATVAVALWVAKSALIPEILRAGKMHVCDPGRSVLAAMNQMRKISEAMSRSQEDASDRTTG